MAQEEMGVLEFQALARTGTVAEFEDLLNSYGAVVVTDDSGKPVDSKDISTGRDYLKEAIYSATEEVTDRVQKARVLIRYDVDNNINDTYAQLPAEKKAAAPAADEDALNAARDELHASNKSVLDAIGSLKKEFQRVVGEQDAKIAALVEKIEARDQTIEELRTELTSTTGMAKNAALAAVEFQVKIDGTEDTLGLEERVQSVEEKVGKVVRTRSPINVPKQQ